MTHKDRNVNKLLIYRYTADIYLDKWKDGLDSVK